MHICRTELMELDIEELEPLYQDALRYRWLRERDVNAINTGGLFVGMTPDNVVLNGDDLDIAIDAAMTPNVELTSRAVARSGLNEGLGFVVENDAMFFVFNDAGLLKDYEP